MLRLLLTGAQRLAAQLLQLRIERAGAMPSWARASRMRRPAVRTSDRHVSCGISIRITIPESRTEYFRSARYQAPPEVGEIAQPRDRAAAIP